MEYIQYSWYETRLYYIVEKNYLPAGDKFKVTKISKKLPYAYEIAYNLCKELNKIYAKNL